MQQETLSRELAESNTLQTLGLKVARQDRTEASTRRKHAVLITLGLVVGVMLYFASGIYGMRWRYPHMFAWHEGMRAAVAAGKQPRPLGQHAFSMYQVCTAANFTPAQSLMELLLVWKHLSFEGANFVLYTIQHFQIMKQKDKSVELTSLHFAGSGAQTQYEKLLGPKGWASGGCGTDTLAQRKQTLCDNWNRSAKEGNIWYDLLPKPTDATGRERFLSIPMIRDLYTDSDTTGGAANACDTTSFFTSRIGMLYSGGICNVAFNATAADDSAAKIFRDYFSSDISVLQSCGGAASAAAVQGAISTGGMGLCMMGMFEPPIAGAIIAAVTTVAGAVAGGVTGAAAAREQCAQAQELAA